MVAEHSVLGQPQAAEPRRRDGDQTRRDILAAAGRMFARRGYSKVTLRDIADEVGITPALIVRYFGSKEGLFDAVGRDEWEFDRQLPLKEGDAARAVAHRIVAYWNDRDVRSPSLALVRSLDHEPAVELFRSELERRIATFYSAMITGPDEEIRVRLITGLLMGFGYFTTGALIDPDSPALTSEEAEAYERYLTGMFRVLLDPTEQQSH